MYNTLFSIVVFPRGKNNKTQKTLFRVKDQFETFFVKKTVYLTTLFLNSLATPVFAVLLGTALANSVTDRPLDSKASSYCLLNESTSNFSVSLSFRSCAIFSTIVFSRNCAILSFSTFTLCANWK